MNMKQIALAVAAGTALVGASPVAAQENPDSSAQADTVDPERLALAKVTIDAIWPTGTYERMMKGTMERMMDAMMGSILDLPLEAYSVNGAPKDMEGTLSQIAEIEDPFFRERMKRSTKAMMDEMFPLLNEVEPDIRDGLIEAYARKYNAQQLREMNAFFATPAGAAYARDAYMMFMDPAVMKKMQGFMPSLMKRMPAIIEKVEAATADLPPPRRFDDLTDEEKARLAELKGTTVEELQAATVENTLDGDQD